MSVGKKLKKWIKERFGNVNRAAIELDEHPITIHNYIKEVNKPGAPFLIKIYRYGCDLNWLLGEGKINMKDVERAKQLQDENIRLRKEIEAIRKRLGEI